MFVEHKEQGEVTEAPAKTLDEASKLLLKAADLIEASGLCKTGEFEDKNGQICFQCALNIVTGDGRRIDKSPVWREANNRMGAYIEDMPFCWIEQPGVTTEICVSKMRAAALGL